MWFSPQVMIYDWGCPLINLNDEAFLKEVECRTPVKRTGKANEISSLVAFLCTPEASYITNCSDNFRWRRIYSEWILFPKHLIYYFVHFSEIFESDNLYCDFPSPKPPACISFDFWPILSIVAHFPFIKCSPLKSGIEFVLNLKRIASKFEYSSIHFLYCIKLN